MILADKIIMLRKRNGWSQEELAEKVEVSRQSVSKWEGAQSIPELDRILKLSSVFGLSTDFLLKDELEEAEYIGDAEENNSARLVTIEEANSFLNTSKLTAQRTAFAVFLCIVSPISLILLGIASDFGILKTTEGFAYGTGITIMLLLVTAAVAIFIDNAAKTRPFRYLENDEFRTEYGVAGMVRDRQKNSANVYTKYNIIGVCTCILAALPLILGGLLSQHEFCHAVAFSISVLLVAIGVVFLVITGVNRGSMEKLLQEGEYTERKRKTAAHLSAVAGVYWIVVAAAFLAYSFYTNDWRRSWIIWPVSGVLFPGVIVISTLVLKKKEEW